MTALMARISIIGLIIKKDLVDYFREWLWVLISALGLVFYVLIFWLLPGTVDESIRIGIRQTDLDITVQEIVAAEKEGVKVVLFESSEQLKAAVAGKIEMDNQIRIGVNFPHDFREKIRMQKKTVVQIYLAPGVPKEISRVVSSLVREIAYKILGDDLPITEPDQQAVVLGEDRIGNQVPFREKMRPVLVFFILTVEAFALASLISGEIQAKTITAVLVTPARIGDILAAKTILGTLVAFVQAVVLLLAVNAMDAHVLLMLAILLLASLMVTGIGMIVGSAGKDFMTTLIFGMIFMVFLAIPAFAVLFPGMVSPWVKILPSYGIVEMMVGTTVYGKGWGGSVPYLVLIAVWDTIILGSGLLALKKRVEAL
jgi:ABC-2 type transport system permease protein